MSKNDDADLTTKEAMKELSCSRSCLYQNEVQVLLGAYKWRNQLRWPMANIQQYKKENKVVRKSNHKNVEAKKYKSKIVASKHKLW